MEKMKKEPKIKEIIDPKEDHIKVKTKSILIMGLERKSDEDFKSVAVRCFEVNNPHKKQGVFPTKVYKFSNIEKVRIRRMNVSYYIEGEDIVVNDLEEIYLIREGTKLMLKGYQYEVEKREKDE
ncbi:MAG: hypothetical protein KKF46_06850 [Nanoarchaeota archaeon]|nr:hypothetical protein [Nanoarchaeota archaeon]MBU1322046.1 hypothetical protein [Nanoarchaeota archaeon]MBU1597238.1 hypothetical protein [Nanoarchaeota archaeon]MBU2440717.1 hypothetical protein [Nanoarchaeota archaeon]